MTDRLSLPRLSGPFYLQLKVISASITRLDHHKVSDPYVVLEFTRGSSTNAHRHTQKIRGPSQ